MAETAAAPAKPKEANLHLSFNQDGDCCLIADQKGWRIYHTPTFQLVGANDTVGPLAHATMLFRTNIMAYIHADRPHHVQIWDNMTQRSVAELSFRQAALSVRFTRHRVVVATEHKIYVYNFANLQLLHSFETCSNPRGLFDLTANEPLVLACPGTQPGTVRVEQPDTKTTHLIAAHENELACLALDSQGQRLATGSTRGTRICVFDTRTGALVKTLRRGSTAATLHCLVFSRDGAWLAASGSTGTVHLFRADTASDPGSDNVHNRQSIMSWGAAVLPQYFASEWSCLSWKLPVTATDDVKRAALMFAPPAAPTADSPNASSSSAACNVGNEVVLYVACADGYLYRVKFKTAAHAASEPPVVDCQSYLLPAPPQGAV